MRWQRTGSTRSVESLRELRLLGDLIGEQGKTQAAETLGVSSRTLTRFEESRRLTPTLAGALERHLLEGAGRRRPPSGIVRGCDGLRELEGALREGLAALRKEGEARSPSAACGG